MGKEEAYQTFLELQDENARLSVERNKLWQALRRILTTAGRNGRGTAIVAEAALDNAEEVIAFCLDKPRADIFPAHPKELT